MKKKRLMLAICVAIFTHNIYAIVPRPYVCPDVGAIKALGLVNPRAVRVWGDLWAVSQEGTHRFDTKELWGFFVKVKADSSAIAIQKAELAFSQMNFEGGPEFMDNAWTCVYDVPNDKVSVGYAVTPPANY